MAATPRLEIEKLSVEQLRALKEQADLEVNLLQDSLNNIRSANARLEIAATALHDLSIRPQGLHSPTFSFDWSSIISLFNVFFFLLFLVREEDAGAVDGVALCAGKVG